jgi:hypothetical protein
MKSIPRFSPLRALGFGLGYVTFISSISGRSQLGAYSPEISRVMVDSQIAAEPGPGLEIMEPIRPNSPAADLRLQIAAPSPPDET